MTDQLRVLLEIGPKGKRVVASAMDGRAWSAGAGPRDEAVDRLLANMPRYAPVAERVGLRAEFERSVTPHILERTPGNTSTDWWGIAHVPSVIEGARSPMTSSSDGSASCVRQGRTSTMRSDASDAPLTHGPRGGGRERDQIVRHVYASERHNFWRKVAIREEDGVRLTPEELADLRERYVATIREYHAEDRPARRWPLRFLIRRTAQHAMDHAWELEDRDPG